MGSFKTKARAIELLGRTQIRDGVTALAELMKNSYDADADWIRVEFAKEGDRPYLLICDSGHGMSEDDIENKWLVLGTDSKHGRKKVKTPKGRTLMGAKGIGRLASARLGHQMILFTKTTNTNWNILYMNWNIFENPDLLIEEVNIPSMYDCALGELEVNTETLLKELKSRQQSNLNLDAWFEANEDDRVLKSKTEPTYKLIESQIRDLFIPAEHISFLCAVLESEAESQGTILLIEDLREDWDKYLLSKVSLKEKDNDVITYKNYTRFAAFASDFKNADPNLSLEIIVNNELLDFNFAYTDEDYEIYDLKLEGKVENGKFYGRIYAKNADQKLLDECNDELTQGLDVTQGIKDWMEVQCGVYKVKLCHIEDEKASGLTKDEHNAIKTKMARSGGISVFRDCVRVLPYGEPENDFLSLERRRSQNAGLYLFSHRNMFGRIDINSVNNPMLEDKSSREGLMENAQYHYFIKTLENLLVKVATEYITSRGKKTSKALRDTYVAYYKRLAEEKKKKVDAEELEEKLAEESINSVKDSLKENNKKITVFNCEVERFIEKWVSNINNLEIRDGYIKLSEILKSFRTERNMLKIRVDRNYDDLFITIPIRFASAFTEDLKQKVEKYNIELEDKHNVLVDSFKQKTEEIETKILMAIAQWKQIAEEGLNGRVNDYISIMNQKSNELSKAIDNSTRDIKKNIEDEKSKLLEQIRPIIDRINQIDTVAESLKTHTSDEVIKTLKDEINDVTNKISLLHSLPPEKVVEHANTTINKLESIEKRLYEFSRNTSLTISKEFASFLPDFEPMIRHLQSQAEGHTTDYLLGVLKQKNVELENQLELYSDLASLGLSAEIVSHEFNQLFVNVNDAIRRLKDERLTQDAKYWLRQIEVGFRAISDRQSQLSPMYRSYNLPKRPLKIKTMIDDLNNFFLPILERSDIEFKNCIDELAEVVLSPSKMYPILSNLIHNSVYWTLDRPIKQILFHYDEEEGALYIEDSGVGINKKYAERIFEPFFSLRSGGRGLGLSITKKVLDSQGHKIEAVVDSIKKQLDGACFKITFNQNQAKDIIERG